MKILIYWGNYKISISSNFMTSLVGVILFGFLCFVLFFFVVVLGLGLVSVSLFLHDIAKN